MRSKRDATGGPTDADGADQCATVIIDRRRHAAHAVIVFFVVDGVAAAAGLRQLRLQRGAVGDRAVREGLHFLGHAGIAKSQHYLAQRGAMERRKRADLGFDAQGGCRLDLVNVERLALRQDGRCAHSPVSSTSSCK